MESTRQTSQDHRGQAAPHGGGRLDLRLLGRRVRVRSPDAALLADLLACFDPDEAPLASELALDLRVRVSPASGEPACGLGTVGRDRAWHVATEPPDAFELPWVGPLRSASDLCSALNQWAVVQCADRYVLHAGSVSLGGAAVLLPGRSHAGKSTLTAALLRAGFDLLSDEISALDWETREIRSYPRRLSVRLDTFSALGLDPHAGADVGDGRARMLRPEEFGAGRARDGAHPRLIVSPRYRPSAERVELERLRPGPALMILMESACSQPRWGVAGLDWLIRLALDVPCFQLEYSDVRAAGEVVAAEFERLTGGAR